jgi:hypothetical protein
MDVVGIGRAGKPTPKSLKLNAGVLHLCLMESLREQDEVLSNLESSGRSRKIGHRVQAPGIPHRMPE